MPLPCSPVSCSTASESYSVPNTSGEDSDASLTTPRAGPADPALRTTDALSTPSVPTFLSSAPSASRSGPAADGRADIISSQHSKLVGSYPRQRTSSVGTANGSLDSPGPLSSRSSIRFQTRDSSPRRRALNSSFAGMSRVSPTVSPHGGSHRHSNEAEVGESSADENTAILRREAAASRYGAVGASGSGIVVEEASTTRRKSASGKGKDGPASSSANSEARNNDESSTPARGESWWKRTAEKYGSIELENKGSVARDHLALERTFLAWLRTSLSFASIGIAVTQLFRLNTSLSSDDGNGSPSTPNPAASLKQLGKPLGATFLGISILILLLGFNRYFEGQHYIIRGKFPASRATVVLVSLVAGALIVASLAVVLVVAPNAFES